MQSTMKKLMLTAAVLALTVGVAKADNYNNNPDSLNNNVYLSLGAGWNHEQDADFKTGLGKGTVGMDDGWVGNVAVGHAWAHNLRTEIEGSYRHNDGSSRGDFQSWNAMVNQYYDFNNRTNWVPYIGAGIGASFQKANNLSSPVGAGVSINDSDTQFAYQGIAGLDYNTSMHSTWGVRYNYFGTTRGKFDTSSAAVGGARGEYQNHAILATYRYTWGTAPQPLVEPRSTAVMPAPAPQPMVTQTTTYAAPTEQQIEESPYKIFFANDSAKLTNNAAQVIADAASAAGNQHAVVLQLTSNTDTTGSQRHNDSLSEKRAKSVRAALVAQGVSADKISIISNAERDLPIPTGDGVKEPRNRVVTIVLQ